MRLVLPDPEIPKWAQQAGVPPPDRGEGFLEYVERLGFDPEELLEDLMPAAAACLNLRLEGKLVKALPDQFNSYCREWILQVRAGYSYDDVMEDPA